MSETGKEYNRYLEQIAMIVHPNLHDAFMKIHNKLVEEAVNEAKQFKPSIEWVELKKTIDDMKSKDHFWRKLYLKRILKQIDDLPDDKGW